MPAHPTGLHRLATARSYMLVAKWLHLRLKVAMNVEVRREEAMAQATGLRVLKANGEAVPVRMMKRDLLFAVERLAALLDERRLAVLIRQHGEAPV